MATTYPGVYRAKAQRLDGTKLTANIPQIFGTQDVIISAFVGAPPTSQEMGWVAFHGGRPEFPVWLGVGTGGGGGGTVTDTLWVGTDPPTDSSIELWYDTDEANTFATAGDVWNSAWGILAQFPRGGDGTSVALAAAALPVPITGPLAFTFQTGRRYKLVCYVRALGGSAASTGGFALYDGSTNLTSIYGGNAHFDTVAPYNGVYGEWIIDGAGQTYLNLNFQASTTTATTVYVSPNSQFYVEDIGPITRQPSSFTPPTTDWSPYDARYVQPSALSPAWTDITFASGWKNYAGWQTCGYRKVGDMVYLRGLAQIDTVGTPTTTVTTLPSGFWPPAGLIIAVRSGEPNAPLRLEITSGGVITATSLPVTAGNWVSLSNISFSVTA